MKQFVHCSRTYLLVCLGLTLPAVCLADFPPQDIEFFEKQIRPLLASNCFECHGDTEQEAGLRLDSRAAIIRGGAAGPAIVPRNVEKSLLVEAIRYDNPDFQMPPDGKLAAAKIALLEKWVKHGAPWPHETTSDGPATAVEKPNRRHPSDGRQFRAEPTRSIRPCTQGTSSRRSNRRYRTYAQRRRCPRRATADPWRSQNAR